MTASPLHAAPADAEECPLCDRELGFGEAYMLVRIVLPGEAFPRKTATHSVHMDCARRVAELVSDLTGGP